MRRNPFERVGHPSGPRPPRAQPRRARMLLLTIVAAAVVAYLCSTTVSYYVDFLWFGALFQLPAWELLTGCLTILAAMVCAVAAAFVGITAVARVLTPRRIVANPTRPLRGLAIGVAALLLTVAARVYFGRFERLFEDHAIFSGVDYTQAHITLGSLLVVCGALVVGAAIALTAAMRTPRFTWIVGSVVPAAVCYIAVQLVAWYVSTLIVRPNQLNRERPYIIDIDRYRVGGHLREMMLAARELDVQKPPVSSQTWINEKLIYTHGYGVAMTSVNGFTPEGLPKLVLKNMPVESSLPGLTVTRPKIYFGELTHTDVYVKTRQQEFNYSQGEQNNMAAYHGSGGIRIGGLLRRTFIAYDRGDIAKQSAPRAAKPPTFSRGKGLCQEV